MIYGWHMAYNTAQHALLLTASHDGATKTSTCMQQAAPSFEEEQQLVLKESCTHTCCCVQAYQQLPKENEHADAEAAQHAGAAPCICLRACQCAVDVHDVHAAL